MSAAGVPSRGPGCVPDGAASHASHPRSAPPPLLPLRGRLSQQPLPGARVHLPLKDVGPSDSACGRQSPGLLSVHSFSRVRSPPQGCTEWARRSLEDGQCGVCLRHWGGWRLGDKVGRAVLGKGAVEPGAGPLGVGCGGPCRAWVLLSGGLPVPGDSRARPQPPARLGAMCGEGAGPPRRCWPQASFRGHHGSTCGCRSPRPLTTPQAGSSNIWPRSHAPGAWAPAPRCGLLVGVLGPSHGCSCVRPAVQITSSCAGGSPTGAGPPAGPRCTSVTLVGALSP